ncbi:3',5'-nucleoside bisphosphate phosphatase [Pseudogulbenkiania ferrooxidans]|uniref:PHP domain protein n=1 Tax=Pseudogulbenkiania ferrooxidans 2002 TaxID=279714 RepID=B9Z6L8_9NEIS|nr:3',5'-nucleoside bisphosphate phosphatase [Pseudogulbenkiania ferrooxidans]EEG07593.1 PHP domain protein [Pseudogulbenkiania ferrooxidans 2002]
MADIDLHFHSLFSDGALSPAEVIRRGAERGATLLALTDHDCTAGLAEAAATARNCGVSFLNGVEISVSWGKHTVHIVGLGIDPDHDALAAGLQGIRDGRINRARAMAESLAKVGIEGAFEGASALCDNLEMIGRTHVARYLVSSGHVKDVRSVFRKYLTPGKPGYVPHEWASLADAVGWICSAGGIAVIAHPGRYDMGRTLTERLIFDFKDAGGEAIEVASGSHSLDDLHKYALIAQRYDLLASAGSDFHAPGEGGRDVGRTDDLPPICRPVWQRLLENGRVLA